MVAPVMVALPAALEAASSVIVPPCPSPPGAPSPMLRDALPPPTPNALADTLPAKLAVPLRAVS